MNVAINVDLRRIRRQKKTGDPGPVHLCLNGRPVGFKPGAQQCASAVSIRNHESGFDIVSVADWFEKPCRACAAALDSRVASSDAEDNQPVAVK
ncbi:MAG: hypothetical protein ACJ76P_13830 [Actinomycetota bacterium]